MSDRHRLEEAAGQARRDLEELAMQVESGEIDDDTARRLRSGYLRELETAAEDLAGLDETAATAAPIGRSRRRMLIGAGILAAGVALTMGIVGSFAQERDTDALEGVAAGPDGAVDLDSVSNETMEAVIESYRDDPAVADQLPLMEFRLAERYFEDQDYLESFPHYRNVIENPNAPSDRVQVSLTRVGWLVWILNGETELALTTLDQALSIDPSASETLYVKGQVLWCGAGRPDEAVPLFEQVLADPGLDQSVVAQVQTDVELASAGGACG